MNKQKIQSQRTGTILILLAFLLNPYFIGWTFSTDGRIDTPILIIVIICFEIILFISGLCIYYKNTLLKNRAFATKLGILILSLLLCFAALELTIRILGSYDADGQFVFGGRYLEPKVLPVNSIKEEIQEFENITNPYAIPDRYLGWTIANNSNSLRPAGYYQSNSIGVRSYREFNVNKRKGTLRIAMFGDSFIHSYDVPMNETLAHHLEQELSQQMPVEVMNFGVGAYGIDQAYLRWKLKGKAYTPDIVIIGFQAENCKRNVNIIRKLYFKHSEIPFSKPRFVMINDSLALVNYPTIPYKDLPNTIQTFETSQLARSEYYYHKTDYATTNPFLYSKLASYIITRINEYQKKKKDVMNYEESSEIGQLCRAILRMFYTEASNNSTVYILHLPTQQDLAIKMTSSQNDFVYEKLLAQLRKDFNVIDPTTDLLNEAHKNTLQTLFVGHYSNKANEIIAKNTADVLFNNILPCTPKHIKTNTLCIHQ